MRLTRTLATILAGTLCLTALCSCTSSAGDGSSKKDRDKDEETKVTATEASSASIPAVTAELCELPEREIIIHTHSDNYAEGYQASDIFVMSDGSVYASDEYFSGYTEEYYDPMPAEDRLALLQLYTKPFGQFDVNALTEAYSYMQYADPDAEFVYEDEVTYDGGYSSTSVNVGGEWVKISEGGVYTGWLDDVYAKAADEIISDEFYDAFDTEISTHIYSKDITFLKTYELGDADVQPCKMLITDMEELRAFEKMTGIDLEGNECFESFGDPEYDSFKSMCIAVEIVAYDEVFGLDNVETDAFIVSKDYVGFGCLGWLKMATTDLRLGVDKYYCYVAQVPAYDMSVYEGFVE